MVALKKTLADKLEDGRYYEIGYLLSPAISETALEEAVSQLLVEPITVAHGEIEEQETPTLITLAYPIRKTVDHKTSIFQTAFLGSIRFMIEPVTLDQLAAAYRSRPEILRFLLIERPPIAPVLPTPPAVSKRNSGAKEGPPVTAAKPPSLDEAALDREIDQLLSPVN